MINLYQNFLHDQHDYNLNEGFYKNVVQGIAVKPLLEKVVKAWLVEGVSGEEIKNMVLKLTPI